MRGWTWLALCARTGDGARRFLLLSFTVALTAALAGCGGDDDNDADPRATPTAVTQLTAAARAQALCAIDASSASAPARAVQAPEAIEISGIAASRVNEGVLWAHNDSGDTARVFAFAADGRPRGVFDLAGAEAVDWEDMAIAAQSGGDYLYLADIGDNGAVRPGVVVYLVVEPELGDGNDAGTIDDVGRIDLRYPDAPHDAETLLVDPLSGDLVIVTKEIATGNAGIYSASPEAWRNGTATMVKVGEIEKARLTPAAAAPEEASALVRGVGYLPTGGDVSRDGALIAIRTYASVFIWPRAEGQSIAEALAGVPCEAPSAIEQQGEAIAFNVEGDGYFTVSEGANPPVYHFRTAP